MTAIHRLHIINCRHFDNFLIEACTGINLITGPNASGKTTILEAIYVLAHGKSFRASSLDDVIHKNHDAMTLFIELSENNSSFLQPQFPQLGLKKTREQVLKLRLNQEDACSIKLLTEQLPIQLITTESTRFFTDGPKLRRDFLAWGLFYTNDGYYKLWKQHQRALAQRNQALKFKLPAADLKFWSVQLVEAAEKLDICYQNYLKIFELTLVSILKKFLPDLDLNLYYDRGWPMDMSLQESLLHTLDKSYALGHTTVGSHRLDLQLYANQKEAQHILSRGQLKLCSYAFSLAQGLVLKELKKKSPVYLIDDIAAELDLSNQILVFDILNSLNAQVFLTAIDRIDNQTDFQGIKTFILT